MKYIDIANISQFLQTLPKVANLSDFDCYELYKQLNINGAIGW